MAKKKEIPAGVMVKGEVTIDGIHLNDGWARSLKARKLVKEGKEDETETSAEDQFYNDFANHPNLAHLDEGERRAWAAKAYKACIDAADPE